MTAYRAVGQRQWLGDDAPTLLPVYHERAIEAAGEIATGAAWSRVAEPFAGEAEHGDKGGQCLNCRTRLTGRYCHACGQSVHVHRTLMSIVHDLLHGGSFRGQGLEHGAMPVLHPGQLTRRYIAGERVRFVSPLAVSLFTVLLMRVQRGWAG